MYFVALEDVARFMVYCLLFSLFLCSKLTSTFCIWDIIFQFFKVVVIVVVMVIEMGRKQQGRIIGTKKRVRQMVGEDLVIDVGMLSDVS
jgi:hypothetical protein